MENMNKFDKRTIDANFEVVNAMEFYMQDAAAIRRLHTFAGNPNWNIAQLFENWKKYKIWKEQQGLDFLSLDQWVLGKRDLPKNATQYDKGLAEYNKNKQELNRKWNAQIDKILANAAAASKNKK